MTMFRQIAPDGIVNRQVVAERTGSDRSSCASLNQGSKTMKSDGVDTSAVHAVDIACEAKEGTPPEVNGFPEKGADEVSQASGLSDSSSWTRISESAIADQQPNGHLIVPTGNELPPSGIPDDPTAPTAYTSLEAAEPAETTRENTVTHEENPEKYEQAVEQPEASKADGMQPVSGDGRSDLTGLNADAPKDVEHAVMPGPGEAVVAPAWGGEVQRTHEEMSRVTAMECPFLMNRE